jgi:hypothetical protein
MVKYDEKYWRPVIEIKDDEIAVSPGEFGRMCRSNSKTC